MAKACWEPSSGAEFKTAFVGGRLAAALAAAHRRLELERAVGDPEERAFMHWAPGDRGAGRGPVDEADYFPRINGLEGERPRLG